MRPNVFNPGTTASLCLLAALSVPAMAGAQNNADKLYNANCVLCHGADGSGGSPTGKAVGAKDLKSAEVQKLSDADLNTAITNGKGKMPAFGKKLKPADITALVGYVRSLAAK